MNYKYTDENQLHQPCKYAYTEYQGIEFLKSYKINRFAYLSKTDKKVIHVDNVQTVIDDALNLFQDKYSATPLTPLSGDRISTDLILMTLREEIKFCRVSFTSLKNINDLVKRYEVSKKIYSSYDLNFKNPEGDCTNIDRYCIFSLVLMALFHSRGNFQYLSTALKVNDLIISALGGQKENVKLSEKISACIKSEVKIILYLESSNGVIQ